MVPYFVTVRNDTIDTSWWKGYGRHYTLRYDAKRFGMERNGTIFWEIVNEERCDMNGVIQCDTTRRLQCGKLRCGAVFTVRCINIRYGAMRNGAVSMLLRRM